MCQIVSTIWLIVRYRWWCNAGQEIESIPVSPRHLQCYAGTSIIILLWTRLYVKCSNVANKSFNMQSLFVCFVSLWCHHVDFISQYIYPILAGLQNKYMYSKKLMLTKYFLQILSIPQSQQTLLRVTLHWLIVQQLVLISIGKWTTLLWMMTSKTKDFMNWQQSI